MVRLTLDEMSELARGAIQPRTRVWSSLTRAWREQGPDPDAILTLIERELDRLDEEGSGSNLEEGDIVQLDPKEHTHHEGFWAANLMIVTEVKSWGAQGYCRGQGGNAYYRAKTGTFEKVGEAVWVSKEA